MTIGIELMITILLIAVNVGVFVGGVKSLKKEIGDLKEKVKEDFCRLERKQDKYNNLQERVVLNEASTKSAHKRIDVLHHQHMGE